MTNRDLQRFSEAVLILNECRSADNLGASLLGAMEMVCDADSFAVNSIGASEMDLYAASVIFTEPQLEAFFTHLAEHPFIGVIQGAIEGRRGVGRWSDLTTLRKFRQKALYHDFFRCIGTRHQLGAAFPVSSQIGIGLSFNRGGNDFRPEDVQLLDQLIPHVSQLVTRMMGQREVEVALALRELAAGGEAVMIVDAEGALLFATERARELARDYFPATLDGVPREIRAWLKRRPAAHEKFLGENSGGRCLCTAGPQVPWAIGKPGAMFENGGKPMAVRCLRFHEQRDAKSACALTALGLTLREAEVLRWMMDGKRNSEIAIICGLNVRTVDKHAENLFRKLSVETRTAAVARAWEAIG